MTVDYPWPETTVSDAAPVEVHRKVKQSRTSKDDADLSHLKPRRRRLPDIPEPRSQSQYLFAIVPIYVTKNHKTWLNTNLLAFRRNFIEEIYEPDFESLDSVEYYSELLIHVTRILKNKIKKDPNYPDELRRRKEATSRFDERRHLTEIIDIVNKIDYYTELLNKATKRYSQNNTTTEKTRRYQHNRDHLRIQHLEQGCREPDCNICTTTDNRSY